MKNILAGRQHLVLQQLAQAKTLLAFDFDGTLAPITADPTKVKMRSSTRRLLSQITKLYPCAIVTGRGRLDAVSRLEGVGIHEVVGNHGSEWNERGEHDAKIARLVWKWQSMLVRHLSAINGVVMENKSYSIALHYRKATDKEHTLARLQRVATSLPSCRVVPGILSINLMPSIGHNKGSALASLLKRHGAQRGLFVGDDVTDEDAFAVRSLQNTDTVGVRVGREAGSKAKFFLSSQRMIDELLRRLCHLRLKAINLGKLPKCIIGGL